MITRKIMNTRTIMIPIKVLKSCRLQLNLTLGHLVNSSHVKTEDIIMSPKLTIVQVNNLLFLSISTPVYVYMLFAAHHHIEFATQSKNHQSIISLKKKSKQIVDDFSFASTKYDLHNSFTRRNIEQLSMKKNRTSFPKKSSSSSTS